MIPVAPQPVDLGVGLTAAPPRNDLGPIISLVVKAAIVVGVALFVWLRFFHSTAPSAEEIDAAFVPVVGYEYGEDSVAADMVEGYISNYPGFEDEIEDFEVREVMQGGRPIGMVMIGGFEYSEDKQADFDSEAAVEGVTSVSLGTPGKTFTAYQATQPPVHAYIWLDDDGYFFVVATALPTSSETLATALGSAQL